MPHFTLLSQATSALLARFKATASPQAPGKSSGY